MHSGEEDVTWPGMPHYFALSSGTTGKSSKQIQWADGYGNPPQDIELYPNKKNQKKNLTRCIEESTNTKNTQKYRDGKK